MDRPATARPCSQEGRDRKEMRYTRTDPESAEPSGDSDLNMTSRCRREASCPLVQYGKRQAESRKVNDQSEMPERGFQPRPPRPPSSQATAGRALGHWSSPADELRNRLEKLPCRNQLILANEDIDRPSKLGENTEDYERLGGFINFRRGGRSADGSFHYHVLSSALTDTSELAPEESSPSKYSKQFPSVRIEQWESFTLNRTASPWPSPCSISQPREEADCGRPRKQRQSLKLFQPYDTFTNQTLLRRLSQFEGDLTDSTREATRQGSLAPVRARSRRRGQDRG